MIKKPPSYVRKKKDHARYLERLDRIQNMNSRRSFNYPACMEMDMQQSPNIIQLVSDDGFAGELYSAMCNTMWYRSDINFDETYKDEMLELLAAGKKYTFTDDWSCSWRSAGGIVADLRNAHHGKNEDYMSFYCGGNEGHVSSWVANALLDINWSYKHYPD